MSAPARDAYWDNCRAVLMWLVVLGHTIQLMDAGRFFANPLFKAIYLFHVPLFMWVSGYFALGSLNKDGLKVIPKRAVRLLLPIATIGSLQVALLLWQGKDSWQAILGAYHCMWFLWSLFECFCFAAMMQLWQNRLWKFAAALLPILVSVLLPEALPYGPYLSFVWPFFLMGMYCRYKGVQTCHFNWRWLGLFPVAVVIFYCYRNHWYMYLSPLKLQWDSLGIWSFRIAAAVVSGVIFLALMRFINFCLLSQMGKGTLGIYVVQCVSFTLAAKIAICPTEVPLCLIIPASIVFFVASYSIYCLTRSIPILGTALYGGRN